jgi:hypothetical protein
LATLRQRGTFVKPWVESPFLWLIAYDEHCDNKQFAESDRLRLNEIKLSLLPQEVQAAICRP